MRKCLLTGWFLLLNLLVLGQTTGTTALTTIVGEVTDAHTSEPIEGVSVYFRGTPYGTSTTKEGVFLLRAPLEKKTVMVVSAVGYTPQRFKVSPGQSAGIDVRLQEETTALEDVFVLPGTNPALALMDSVRAHRKEWQRHWTDGETQTEVFLSNIRARHLRRKMEKTLQDTADLLPLYSSANPEIGKGSVNADIWKVFLPDPEQRVDFYRSTISFCGTAFLSPIAANSNRYYMFLLADSSFVQKRKTYELLFRTRNPYYATFDGRLLIDSATCALRRVEADVPPETNVNYLRHLHIEQDFSFDTAFYALRRESVTEILDIAVKADTTHTFPTLLIRSGYRLPHNYSAADTHDTVRVKKEQSSRDSVLTPPLLRLGNFVARIALTGCIPTGTAVDFGKVPDILRFNDWEKVRVGLPLRTNAHLSERVCLEAYAAYGFGDRAWKGAGTVHYLLPTQRRNILSLGYSDDYTATDADRFTRLKMENSAWYQDRSLTSHWTEPFSKETSFLTNNVRRREISLQAESDWSQGVESRAHLAFGQEGGFRYSQAGVTVRFSWRERKADLFFQRVHIYNNLPVVYLNAEIGSVHYNGEKSYDMYGKLRLMIRQRVNLGMAGRLDYLAETGCLLGKVSGSMGFVFAGNDSYAFDPYCFTLMRRNRFTARRYVSLQAEWNGRGCLFNRIPWIQRLRLRELLIFKAAYGGDLSVPYVETGAGIGNILRIADLHAVFRVTRFDDSSSPWWGIRFRFHIEG